MAYETIGGKKFLSAPGVGHLWEKIRERFDSKLDSVVAADHSIIVTNNNQIAVAISDEADNALQLKTTGNRGLYVAPNASDVTYGITKDDDSGTYSAVYHLKRYSNDTPGGVDAGVAINIPKDMVVQRGYVATKSTDGDWGPPGTYIEIVLANSNNTMLWIPVGSLVEYVSSGSQAGDTIIVNVDPDTHQVTASITNGTITKAMLHQTVQDSISLADTSIQQITTGDGLGQIKVDGVNVNVYGIGTAAGHAAEDFDPVGSAAAIIGVEGDTAEQDTLHGVRKWASDAYVSIQALTNTEINSAISEANAEIDFAP